MYDFQRESCVRYSGKHMILKGLHFRRALPYYFLLKFQQMTSLCQVSTEKGRNARIRYLLSLERGPQRAERELQNSGHAAPSDALNGHLIKLRSGFWSMRLCPSDDTALKMSPPERSKDARKSYYLLKQHLCQAPGLLLS